MARNRDKSGGGGRPKEPSFRVAVIGAGRGGSAVLHYLLSDPGIEVVGIYDPDPTAPGLMLARRRNVPVFSDAEALLASQGLRVVFEFTGDEAVRRDLLDRAPRGVEVVGARTLRFAWDLIGARERLVEVESSEYEKEREKSAADREYRQLSVFTDLIRDQMVQIRTQKSRIEALVQTSHDGIFTVGADKRVVSWNQGCERLTGVPAGEAIGRVCSELTRPVDAAGESICERRCPVFVLEGEDKDFHVEGRMTHQDGREVWVQISGSDFVGEGDDAEAFVLLHDISAIKALEQTKDEFLSIASHELRTPMTAIKGFISMILDGDLGDVNEDVREVLAEAYKGNDRLIELVQDMLDVSRIEQGRISLAVEKTGLGRLIEETVRLLVPAAQDKGIALLAAVKGRGGLKVMADPDKTTQVLTNLIGNAVKFTDQGSVEVSATRRGKEVCVEITDTGPGISLEDQERLFQKFSRVGGSVTSRKMGTGLGLYISKKLIEMQGGRMWVESSPGKGSTFGFSLPAEARAASPKTRRKAASGKTRSKAAETVASRARGA